MTSPIGTPQCSFHPNPDWNRGLPGIDYNRSTVCMPYSASAPREYADNEGWQIVKRRGGKKYKSQGQSKKRKETEAAIAAADN